MTRQIRLIVADDHVILREGLVALLADEPDIQVLAQAGTGREALKQIEKYLPDVALLDITMPDMTGLELSSLISMRYATVKVVILTMHEGEAFFLEALKHGARGYVLKGANSEELLNAIRGTHEGHYHLPPGLIGLLVEDYVSNQEEIITEDLLSPRELEVLTLIAKGRSNQAIANQLVISINTVKTHRSRIYEKLGFNNKSRLVDYAIRRRLLMS